ncbi:MAG: ABC transporter ATP-binding protein [Sphingomonadales bacterium]|nr:ABC transporter ATP-binding protein [Sphingomonadales bacterium]
MMIMPSPHKTPVIDICNLSLEFPSPRGAVKALKDVSLHINPGEIVGLVGESGSGKSVIAMSAMRLLPQGQFRQTGGTVRVLGSDIMAMSEAELERRRGRDIAMVFQEPMNALNPTIRIGRQITAILRRHQGIDHQTAIARALSLLESMQVDDALRVMDSYPHMLSGGMRQRVLLAMAFSCEPSVLVADEPTTALDVLTQAEILRLIWRKARDLGAAVLFITHDMAIVHQLCDRVYVLYAGEIAESGRTADVLRCPAHPYTRALLAAMPGSKQPKSALDAIDGTVPSLIDPPRGCRFQSRCKVADDQCGRKPAMEAVVAGAPEHEVACWRNSERRAKA